MAHGGCIEGYNPSRVAAFFLACPCDASLDAALTLVEVMCCLLFDSHRR